ncbi:MAG: 2-oxo acid dehydrogenase subunit E2 [Acidimicrobiales bacterium]|jgi:pyruvate dehydrogenase E2 component (dihydrolipoamide acetyltransferase)
MAKIFIPSIGVAMEEALLVGWLKQPGEEVAAEEAVAEIETDKATMELTSPVSGKMGSHLFEPGAIIPVGATIAEVLEEGEPDAAEPGTPEAPTLNTEPAAAPTAPVVPAAAESGPAPRALSPRARRMAREREAEAPPKAEAPPQAERFRALIAAKVAESWKEIPHFAVTREVDAEPMLATLDHLRMGDPEPVPTLTDLLLRALALGLREYGQGNADDVGLAVATDHGVVIPVVHDVLGRDAAALAAARKAAIERARSGRLSAEDLAASASSTLSNLGSFGVDQFTGIIAVGQTSLLTVGRAAPRVVADDARTLRIRTSFIATLNVDHRVIDGAAAARLLAAFAGAAEAMTSTF